MLARRALRKHLKKERRYLADLRRRTQELECAQTAVARHVVMVKVESIQNYAI